MKDERYYSFSTFCKNTFGRRLYRAALDAGMTCPNRDGRAGTRGCIFCSGKGSGEFALAYKGQKLSREDLIWNHRPAQPGDFIAYFQAFTNTYAPAEQLKKLFTAALGDPLFAGIDIATRPDCLGEDVLALLRELKEEYPDKFIWIELGLQTIHETTANYIRRGYPLAVFDEAVKNLHEIGIPVITHVIIGLPGEDREMILETIRHLNRQKTDGIKLHLLHILKHTDLAEEYEKGIFTALDEDAYVGILCDCIAALDPHIVIHRLTGDGDRENLIAPRWSLDKRHVLNRVRHELAVRDIEQGQSM